MNTENVKLSNRAYIAIGLMLFALFFGAGNLIFPASLDNRPGLMCGGLFWASL